MRSPMVHREVRRLAARGWSDSDIAEWLGLPRTTVRDIRAPRRPTRVQPCCPRCWRPARGFDWSSARYAELLAVYLGDGCISELPRTHSLRISLDARYPRFIDHFRRLVELSFTSNAVGLVPADGGSTLVLCVYSRHLPCLFPQHAAGKKHERRIELEPWQRATVEAHPWEFIRGCLWTDGCSFVNRTGRYEYLSFDFHNVSADIL